MKKLFFIIGLVLCCAFNYTQAQISCVSNFDYSGTAADPYTFIFVDNSYSFDNSEVITSWYWDFGQGITSTEANPQITFPDEGFWTPCLTIGTNYGCTTTTCDTLLVSSTGTGGGCTITANYIATVSGAAVSFTDFSNGAFLWYWDMGDGNTSLEQNPVYTYANPGSYVACLTVTDPEGCNDTYCDTLTISSGTGSDDCDASFTASANPASGATFSFFATAANSIGSNEFYWNFGDGNTSYQQNPEHTYTVDGTYEACLSLITPDSLFCDYCTPITVIGASGTGNECAAAASAFPADSLGTSGLWYFYATATGTPPFTYIWTLADGNVFTGETAEYELDWPTGIYDVCLEITDVTGCLASDCTSIYIEDGTGGDDCDASYQYFPDSAGTGVYNFYSTNGPTLSGEHYWTFDNGIISNDANPIHTFANAGIYTVCHVLTTTSTSGSIVTCDACQDIEVTIAGGGDDCLTTFTYFPIDSIPTPGYEEWMFVGTTTGSTAPVTYEWVFANGDTYTGSSFTTSLSSPGTYELCLYATDADGCTAEECQAFTLSDNGGGCYADFQEGALGDNVFAFYPVSQDPAASYFWDFGDGNTSTVAYPEHTFTEAGIYTVCLTLSNAFGETCSYCIDLVVDNAETGYSLCGGVFVENLTGAGTAFAATVYLFELNTAGEYTAIAEQIIQGLTTSSPLDSAGAFYCFNNVAAGDYIIKAALDPSSLLADGVVPTYYGDVIFWNDASMISLNDNEYNANINMITIGGGAPNLAVTAMNDGIVNGHVMQNELGLANVQVMLLNPDNTPAAYTFTDANGYYEFTGLDNGDYQVYVEMIGVVCTPYELALIDGENVFEDINFGYDGEGNVTPPSVIDGIVYTLGNDIRTLEVYPNPVQNQATIELAGAINSTQNLQVRIFDVTGKLINNYKMASSNNTLTIDASNLVSGIYFVHLTDSNQQLFVAKIMR